MSENDKYRSSYRLFRSRLKPVTSTTTDNATDQVLAALADPTRRRIVELLGEEPRTATQIHRAFPIAAPAVSRHLRVLRDAGVIATRRVPGDDRLRLYTLEPQRLDVLAGWIGKVSRHWQSQLDSFEDYVALRSSGSAPKT
jgi:DNA-binding transcriptional ArsR family regulator